ncbi:MAG: methyltransferase domain-containing protein [Isosphaeraceae bacterium]
MACNSCRVIRLGPLPLFCDDSFVGVPLNHKIEPGDLYRCLDCEIRFRFPVPDHSCILDLYSRIEVEGVWDYGPDRQVWSQISRMIQDAPERSVLDVGCFRGDFLSFLGASWQRFGIEPCASARRVAEQRGVTILADSIETLNEDHRRFGAIVLIDVIEHLTDPLGMLQKLTRMLLPDGRILVFTGSTDAWSWRISGVDYYYSAMPEHVAFFSPTWFRWAASPLGVVVRRIQRLSHHPAPLVTRIDEAAKNIAYIAYRRLQRHALFNRVLKSVPVSKRIGRWRGCWWASARDHILVVMQK